MKPALSIVFFTVASGAGLGLLALAALADLLLLGGGLSRSQLLTAGIVGFVLVAAGLLASTLHLANPKNAWRSFARFRTSWLSREAVFAVLFMLAALMYIASVAWQPSALRIPAAIAVVALAWAVLYCTAMIYASLKPIRQWHTALTPLCYLLFGHYSASLMLIWIAERGQTDTGPYVIVSLVLLALAAVAKVAWIEKALAHAGSSIQSALGMPTAAQVKLLDAGHTHGTFLTNEFAFKLARSHAERLADAFWVAAFAVPALVIALMPDAILGAVLLCLAGLLAERWLFFAEARHTVNLYHGAQRA
jgi:sulfite dehydrogenase (quinone) subunit SoeC